jgi:hypothetical protein
MKLSRFWRVAIATTSAIALSAHAAYAMPAAIGVFGAIFTSISAGTVTAAGVASAIFSAALSYGAQTLLGKMLTPDVKPKGIKQKLESGGDLPISFILGEYCTAGKLAYVNEAGNDLNNMLVMVISLSELPVTSFSNVIYINGERCTIDFGTVDSDPDAPGANFHPVTDYYKNDQNYCWVRFYDGTQTTADPYLRSEFGSDPDKPWTTDHVGRGCAYAIVVCRYSKKGVWSGVPEFKFVLKGIPLYDPRKDSSVGGSGPQRWQTPSTWAFSENPKVMIYNIIRGFYYKDIWVWGGQNDPTSNVDAYCLPLSYWFAAMNHCDENVTLAAGGTIKRYTAGCEIEIDHQPLDVIKELDKSCAGYTTEYGGLWKTWAGPPGSSVLSFTDDDIVITEEQTDNLFRPLQELYNGAHATYVNQNAGWVMKDAPPRMFPDLQAKDGYQLIAEMQFPYVTNTNQVQRLMRAMVLDSRRQITHVLTLPPSAYIDEPFEVNNWNSARNGYVNKKVQVTSIDDQPNCNQLMAFRETNPDDYDWDVSYELPDSVGVLKPVKPAALALDFTVAADQTDNPSGGKDKPAIRINWTWGAEDIDLRWVKYEIRLQGTTKVIKDGTFRNLNEASRVITSNAFRFGRTYQVRLFAQPDRRGRLSDWTSWKNVTCVIVDVPSAPTLTRISDLADDGGLNFYIDVSWTLISQDSEYALKIVNTTDSTTQFKRVDNAGVSGVGKYRLPVTSGKSYTINVRAIGADGGTPGDWSTSTSITVTKKNTAPTAPTVLTVTAGNKRNYLDWNDSPDGDYFRSLVYCAVGTNNFASATIVARRATTSFVHDGLANGTNYYYWVVAQDRTRNDSSKFPVSSTGGRVGQPVKIQAGDYAAASIATADVAPAAITAPLIGTEAVIPSKVFPQDQTLLNRDPEMLEMGNFGFAGTGATMARLQNSYPLGGSRFMMYVLTTSGNAQFSTGIDMPVEGSGFLPNNLAQPIIVDCCCGPKPDSSAAADVFGIVYNVDWYPTDVNGVPGTLISTSSVTVAAATGMTDRFQAIFTPPVGAQVCRLRIVSNNIIYPTQPVPLYIASLHVRRQLAQNDMALGSVNTWQAGGSNATQTCGAGTHKQVAEVISNQNIAGRKQVNFLELTGEFRNNSGGTRTMDITIEGAATSTVYRTWPDIVLHDGEFWTGEIQIDSPTEFVYDLYVTMVTAGTVVRARLASKVRFC